MMVLAPTRRPVRVLARTQTAATGNTAEIVAGLLREICEHERQRATDWRPIVRARIDELAAECSMPNWDGYGAAKVSVKAKESAQRFTDSLPVDLPQPDPVPAPDGDISLCWDFGPDRMFTVSIDAADIVSYAGLLGRGVRRHGQEMFRGDVPKIVIESIREISGPA